jgi:hypothetical protein
MNYTSKWTAYYLQFDEIANEETDRNFDFAEIHMNFRYGRVKHYP